MPSVTWAVDPVAISMEFDSDLVKIWPRENLDDLIKTLLARDSRFEYNTPRERKGRFMMDSFLRGFNGKSESLRKMWEERQKEFMDMDEEVKDLLRIYEDSEKMLAAKEKNCLDGLTAHMKRYLQAEEERKKISRKIAGLKAKIAKRDSSPSEDEDEEEDDE